MLKIFQKIAELPKNGRNVALFTINEIILIYNYLLQLRRQKCVIRLDSHTHRDNITVMLTTASRAV